MNQDGKRVIRVLLVDDHRSVLWGLERLIESDGQRMQTVAKVTSATEALACAPALAPDVILLDIDLGLESGLDAIPELVAKTRAKVLVLTGLRGPEVIDKAMLSGASGVIGKEEQPDDILKAIAKVHAGEIWLDRVTTGRVFKLAQRGDAEPEDPERKKIGSLTQRELEIVQAVAEHAGAPTKTIAEALNISDRTLRNHLSAIYEKLGLLNRLELFVYATKHAADIAARASAVR